MKKMLALLAVLSLLPLSSFAQISGQVTGSGLTQQINLVAPPQNRPDGTASGSTSDREGNTKEALGHPEYTESARRGKMYSLNAAAYTVVAANASAGAIGTFKPIVGFYNPLGSGVNAVITSAKLYSTSGTSGGPFLWNYLCGQAWTPAAGGTIYNNLLSNTTPNGSAMIAQNNVIALSNSVLTTAFIAHSVFGGPDNTVLSSGGEAGHFEDLKGQIVVPPGCEFGLAATAAGTSHVVNASLTWEEVLP